MRFLPVSLNALLVELADLDQTWRCWLRCSAGPSGRAELVPAARTILVQFRPSATSVAALVQAIAARDLSQQVRRDATLVEIPVHYDGEDLAGGANPGHHARGAGAPPHR